MQAEGARLVAGREHAGGYPVVGGEQPVPGGGAALGAADHLRAGDPPLPSPRPFLSPPATLGWDGNPPLDGRPQRTFSGPAIPPWAEGEPRRSLPQSAEPAVEPPRQNPEGHQNPGVSATAGKLVAEVKNTGPRSMAVPLGVGSPPPYLSSPEPQTPSPQTPYPQQSPSVPPQGPSVPHQALSPSPESRSPFSPVARNPIPLLGAPDLPLIPLRLHLADSPRGSPPATPRGSRKGDRGERLPPSAESVLRRPPKHARHEWQGWSSEEGEEYEEEDLCEEDLLRAYDQDPLYMAGQHTPPQAPEQSPSPHPHPRNAESYADHAYTHPPPDAHPSMCAAMAYAFESYAAEPSQHRAVPSGGTAPPPLPAESNDPRSTAPSVESAVAAATFRGTVPPAPLPVESSGPRTVEQSAVEAAFPAAHPSLPVELECPRPAMPQAGPAAAAAPSPFHVAPCVPRPSATLGMPGKPYTVITEQYAASSSTAYLEPSTSMHIDASPVPQSSYAASSYAHPVCAPLAEVPMHQPGFVPATAPPTAPASPEVYDLMQRQFRAVDQRLEDLQGQLDLVGTRSREMWEQWPEATIANQREQVQALNQSIEKQRQDLERVQQNLAVEIINVKVMAQGAAEQAAKALAETVNERQRRETEVTALLEASRATRERLEQVVQAPKGSLQSLLTLGRRGGTSEAPGIDTETQVEVGRIRNELREMRERTTAELREMWEKTTAELREMRERTATELRDLRERSAMEMRDLKEKMTAEMATQRDLHAAERRLEERTRLHVGQQSVHLQAAAQSAINHVAQELEAKVERRTREAIERRVEVVERRTKEAIERVHKAARENATPSASVLEALAVASRRASTAPPTSPTHVAGQLPKVAPQHATNTATPQATSQSAGPLHTAHVAVPQPQSACISQSVPHKMEPQHVAVSTTAPTSVSVSAPVPVAPEPPTKASPAPPAASIRPELRLSRPPKVSTMQGATAVAIPVARVPSAPVSAVTAVQASNEVVVRAVEARVAPVTANVTPGLQILPPAIMDAITARQPPKFSGHAEDWPQWRRRWLPYLREVESLVPTISDSQRIALLRNLVDEATAMWLDHQVEKAAPVVDFEALWAQVDLDFGADDREALRRKLRQLRLVTRGKLTEKAWREYYNNLRLLADQIGDVTEEELGRQMQEDINAPWKKKLAIEEDKLVDHESVVLEGLPEDVKEEEVTEMVEAETGTRPRVVRRVGRKFRVVPAHEQHRAAIKVAYDRQRLAGGQMVRVAPDTVKLSASKINELMVRWLRVDSRVSGAEREPQQYQPQDRRVRYQREVDAEEEDDDEETSAVQAVERGRRATPPRRGGKNEKEKDKEGRSTSAAEVKAERRPSPAPPADRQPTPPPPEAPPVASAAPVPTTQPQASVQWNANPHGVQGPQVQWSSGQWAGRGYGNQAPAYGGRWQSEGKEASYVSSWQSEGKGKGKGEWSEGWNSKGGGKGDGKGEGKGKGKGSKGKGGKGGGGGGKGGDAAPRWQQ